MSKMSDYTGMHAMNNYFIIPLLLICLKGCTPENEINLPNVKEIVIEDASVLISPEIKPEIGSVGAVKAASDGFLVFDHGLLTMHKFDPMWNHQFSFGTIGSGPGEFRSVYNFWEAGNSYMIYDFEGAKLVTFDQDGNWIDDILIESDGFMIHRPVRIEAVNINKFIIPTFGEQGSLFTVVNISTDSIRYLGESITDYVPHFDPEQNRQAVLSGQIPPSEKNRVILSADASGIYCFQQTTAILEKYSLEGVRKWERDLAIPELENLFDYIFRENKRLLQDGRSDMHSGKHGVALLLNLNILEEQPVTVIWVADDEDTIFVVQYPAIDMRPNQRLEFTISKDQNQILFTDALEGVVYEAEWPF
jgi:hypothetical protein